MIFHQFHSLILTILITGSFAQHIKPHGTTTSDRDGIGHKHGELDISTLLKLSKLKKQKSIEVQLFADEISMGFSRNKTNGYSWYGEEKKTGNVMNLLSTDGTSLTGSINAGDTVYHIRTLAEGNVIVEAISSDEFPPEGDPAHSEEPKRRQIADATSFSTHKRIRGSIPSKEAGKVQRADDGSIIDIMCVYTKNSMCAEAGFGNTNGCFNTAAHRKPIEDRCALAVDETNTAYEFSGVDTKLRMVYTGLVDHEDLSSGGFNTLLNQLTNSNDGVMDIVHTWRKEYGADLVALITENSYYCGMAWLYNGSPSNGFAVDNRSCMTGYYTFAHEFGHNQGCNHDRNQYTGGGDASAHNYGWQDPQKRFRSIMAYACAGQTCNKVQRMSNDEFSVNFQGQQLPVGDSSNDCAREINDNKVTISRFMESIDGGGGGCILNQIGFRIEAEEYCAMKGIQTEPCSEGGLSVGYLDQGDWMSYLINVPDMEDYTVEYRVASLDGGGVISLKQSEVLLGTINVPKTGGWQDWTTISHKITFSEIGEQSFTIDVPTAGYNINWVMFSKNANLPPTLSPINKPPSPSPVSKLPSANINNCRRWCDDHPEPWSAKCKWNNKCGGCHPCSSNPTETPTKSPTPPRCKSFCTSYPKAWWKKCTWTKCAGCQECEDLDNNSCELIEFRSKAYPSKCLDLKDSDTNNGNDVLLWQCNGTPSQKWRLDENGYIRSALDLNKCIDPRGPSTDDGTPIQIWDCVSNYDYQQWIHGSDGVIRTKRNNEKCIDVLNADQTSIQVWTFNNLEDKKWTAVCQI